jgi:hypothetical protein
MAIPKREVFVDTDQPQDLNPAPEAAPIPAPEIAAEIPPQISPAAPPAAVAVAPAPSPAPSYRDRGSGLVFFGVVQIILGLLSALMVPLAALGAFMSHLAPGGGMRPSQFISGVSTYAFIAAVFVCLGIGSIQMKRWARALTLVTSCYWLLSGALLTVLMTAVLPVIMRSFLQIQRNATPDSAPEMTTGMMAVILTLVVVFLAFFLIVVPIAFIVFYSRNDVAETVRHRDPVERWTDCTPLPVLGGSVAFAVGALYLFLTGITMPLFPFFGRYLFGISGAACFLAFAALDAYFAVAFFRLKSAAWWIAVFVLPVRLISMAITFTRADMVQAYSKMGMSEQQLQMLNSSPLSGNHVLLWWGLLSSVIIFGYILWLKRYFKQSATAQAEARLVQMS